MKFCNICFNQRNVSDLFEHTGENKTKFIATINAAFIVEANKTERFLDILNNNHTVFDGRIPHLTAKALHFIKSIFPNL